MDSNPPRGPRDAAGVMRALIVEAARASFAQNGFAGTTLRAVAREAGVDPALVHHYFASKTALLDAATTPPPAWTATVDDAWDAEPADRGRAIVDNMLRNWTSEQFRPVMTAILLTAAHDERTRAKLARIIAEQLVAPAEDRLDGDEQLLRAGMVASQLLGFMLMRYVWRVEPLASITDEQAATMMAPVVQHYLEGVVGDVRG